MKKHLDRTRYIHHREYAAGYDHGVEDGFDLGWLAHEASIADQARPSWLVASIIRRAHLVLTWIRRELL